MKWITYVLLQIRRAGKILPAVCLFTLVLCAGVGLLLGAVSAEKESDEWNTRFRIGVVGDTEESYLGFGISALQTLDSSRHTIAFTELTMEEAEKQLQNGALDACIVIPEDFVSAVVRGDVQQLTYITTPQAADFAALIRDELLKTVSVMMVESQRGLYGFIGATNAVRAADRAEHLDRLNRQYFGMILARDTLCEVEVIGMTDGISFMGYLLCGLTVFFLLLSGIAFCVFFVRRERSLARVLTASGMPVWQQITGEYTAYVCVLLPVVLVPVLLLAGCIGAAGLIPEWDGFESLMRYAAGTLGTVIGLTAMQFCLYELSAGVIGSILVQFTAALGLSYMSGCLYPVYFFPDSVQLLASWLPAGMARSCLASALTYDNAIQHWCGLFLYSAIFLCIAVYVRRVRILRGAEVTDE